MPIDPALIEARENVAKEKKLKNGVVVGYNVYGDELYRCTPNAADHYRLMYSQPYRED